jgi:hypothetical protein
MLIRYIFVLSFFLAVQLQAQLPQCNMYQFTVSKSSDQIKLSKAKFLTAFNKGGYNNQPQFFADDIVYFTTNYYDVEQTEIAKFDLFDETLTRITFTEESEYSPTPVPDMTDFSCVRVEKNKAIQTLCLYPEDGIGYPKRYLHNISNIGYHNWIDESTLALFLVEEPHHNLAIADAKSERRKIILDRIGRCLKIGKNNQLYFVHKLNEIKWYIKCYDNKVNMSEIICPTLEGSEDFEILNDGSILMGHGSELFIFDPKKSSLGWQSVADLGDQGIKNISRLILRKNRLIIVDQEAQ